MRRPLLTLTFPTDVPGALDVGRIDAVFHRSPPWCSSVNSGLSILMPVTRIVREANNGHRSTPILTDRAVRNGNAPNAGSSATATLAADTVPRRSDTRT